MIGGAIVGGLGTPSSHSMMIFFLRATLEPDATIDPSLHHLSHQQPEKQLFFLVSRNFYFTKVNVIYIRVRARVDNQKKDCRDIINDEYIPRAFIPLDLVLCGRKHVSNDDSFARNFCRFVFPSSFVTCHFFLAGYFVRLCLGLDTLNMLYAKKFVDVGPKQHTFVRAQTQRVK